MAGKNLFCAVTICFLSWGLFTHAEARTVTLGYVDFPPYEFIEDGNPSGVLVQIVQTLFQRAGIPLKLKFSPFKRAYNDTKAGRLDGLFNFYKIEKRLQYFDYTDPIIKNPLVFFVRRDSDIRFQDLADLKGLEIGVMIGYTYGSAFDESPLFTRESASSHEANFKKLVFGRIDAYPCDKLVGLSVALEHKFSSEIKMLPKPLKVMDGHIGFTKGQHGETIERINAVLSEMRRKGEIEVMINQYVENM